MAYFVVYAYVLYAVLTYGFRVYVINIAISMAYITEYEALEEQEKLRNF